MRTDSIASGIRFLDSQMPAGAADSKVKHIQNKITDVRQQMQKLSSKEELTAEEKLAERKKFQKEISGLNVKLKQRQEELRHTQKRELLAEEEQADAVSAKGKLKDERIQPDKIVVDEAEGTENPDDKSRADQRDSVILKNRDDSVTAKDQTTDDKKVHALMSAYGSTQQADQVGAVILRTKDGIVALKGEIEQDERYGSDTKQKKEELEERNERVRRAQEFQFSLMDQAQDTLKAAAEPNKNEAQDNRQSLNENNISLRPTADEQASEPKLHVSFR